MPQLALEQGHIDAAAEWLEAAADYYEDRTAVTTAVLTEAYQNQALDEATAARMIEEVVPESEAESAKTVFSMIMPGMLRGFAADVRTYPSVDPARQAKARAQVSEIALLGVARQAAIAEQGIDPIGSQVAITFPDLELA